mmetsp:Transcript_38997/g.69249  ORF Transcript_38997/g.69249 Transcript_38997/m.69249 type:complete len:249 (+) Transcript_38997:580-1326(+)
MTTCIFLTSAVAAADCCPLVNLPSLLSSSAILSCSSSRRPPSCLRESASSSSRRARSFTSTPNSSSPVSSGAAVSSCSMTGASGALAAGLRCSAAFSISGVTTSLALAFCCTSSLRFFRCSIVGTLPISTFFCIMDCRSCIRPSIETPLLPRLTLCSIAFTLAANLSKSSWFLLKAFNEVSALAFCPKLSLNSWICCFTVSFNSLFLSDSFSSWLCCFRLSFSSWVCTFSCSCACWTYLRTGATLFSK